MCLQLTQCTGHSSERDISSFLLGHSVFIEIYPVISQRVATSNGWISRNFFVPCLVENNTVRIITNRSNFFLLHLQVSYFALMLLSLTRASSELYILRQKLQIEIHNCHRRTLISLSGCIIHCPTRDNRFVVIILSLDVLTNQNLRFTAQRSNFIFQSDRMTRIFDDVEFFFFLCIVATILGMD